MSSSSEKIQEVLENGISKENMKKIYYYFDGHYNVDLLLAYILYLENKNTQLINDLKKIASGMLTKGESKDQAQYSLEKIGCIYKSGEKYE